ncbi:MAG TPA: DinB family protein [Mucilaginibacter sp.]|nr:DinB family protein [Mucilaginibacter sp.]
MKDQTINPGHITLNQLVTIQVESTEKKLMQTIASIKQKDINQVPFEGSWTAGQVCEHVNLSVSGVINTLKAPVEVTERSPDQYAKELRDLFLNFDLKFPSAPALMPSGMDHDKKTLINTLTGTFEHLVDTIQTADLTGIFPGFKFPGMGQLTRLEWVYLTIYHTQKHIHQIKNIMKYV